MERLQAEREEAEEGMRCDMKAALQKAEAHAARQAASESAVREKLLAERQQAEHALRAEARRPRRRRASCAWCGAVRDGGGGAPVELAAQMQHAEAARTLLPLTALTLTLTLP